MRKTVFRLRFDLSMLSYWAARYVLYELENRIQNTFVPQVRKAQFLDRRAFLAVCKWKTPRSQKHCRRNQPDFIREVTKCAFGTSNERLMIEALTLLHGVNWPTASTILHWFHRDPYPILDFRALWSVGCRVPKQYGFDFWRDYTRYCRKLADKAGVPMRTLDRALWQYSKENQR
jgi:hypothetical protein